MITSPEKRPNELSVVLPGAFGTTESSARRERFPRSVSAILGEAFVPKLVHRVIQVWVYIREAVSFVRIRDLVEQDVVLFQRLGERHRLLIMHVIVPAAVYQHVLLATYSLNSLRDIRPLVTGQVVVLGRQPHVSLGVNGVCNDRDDNWSRNRRDYSSIDEVHLKVRLTQSRQWTVRIG